MSVALVTDSTAYLPAAWAAEHEIRVVPIHVVVGGREHREGVDITPKEVAGALRSYVPVSTSRPTPTAFAEAYAAAAAGGASGIVSMHVSSYLSSTIDSAHLAAKDSPVPVVVVDSRSMGLALGFAVVAGAEEAAAGGSLEVVAQHARERARSATVVFYVDTLEYLRRGGRIGSASAFLGSALAIKPILGLVDGRIEPLEKVRTASRALSRLQQLAVEAITAAPAGADIAVQHLDAAARAATLAAGIQSALGGLQEIPVFELGAAVGAHVGPGTLAVAIVPRRP